MVIFLPLSPFSMIFLIKYKQQGAFHNFFKSFFRGADFEK